MEHLQAFQFHNQNEVLKLNAIKILKIFTRQKVFLKAKEVSIFLMPRVSSIDFWGLKRRERIID